MSADSSSEKHISRRELLKRGAVGATAVIGSGVVGGLIGSALKKDSSLSPEIKGPETIPFLPLSPEMITGPRTPIKTTESILLVYDETNPRLSTPRLENLPSDQIEINEITTQNGKIVEMSVPIEQIVRDGKFSQITLSVDRKNDKGDPSRQIGHDITPQQLLRMIGSDQKVRFYLNAGGIPNDVGQDRMIPAYSNMVDLDPRWGIGYDPGEYSFNASFVKSESSLAKVNDSFQLYSAISPSFNMSVSFKKP